MLLSISLFVYMYVCMYIILQDDTSLEKQISGLLHLSVERVLLLRSNPSCCIISCRWVRFLYPFVLSAHANFFKAVGNSMERRKSECGLGYSIETPRRLGWVGC